MNKWEIETDVMAQCELTTEKFSLSRKGIVDRILDKKRQMSKWESLYDGEGSGNE